MRRPSWWRIGIAVSMVGIVVGACGDDDASAPGAGEESLQGRTFLSESIEEDGRPRPLVEGTRISLSFDRDRISASAGCNSMGAPVTIDSDRIFVGELSTTEMGCDEARHEQDEWLAAVLASDPAYTLDGPRLEIRTDRIAIVLIDREVTEPDAPLEGTTWVLDGLIDRDAVSSVPADVRATVRFAEGRVRLSIDRCSEGGGPAPLSGTTIDLGELEMTLSGCEGPAGDVERALLEVLDGRITAQVEARSLILTHPRGKGLTFQAATSDEAATVRVYFAWNEKVGAAGRQVDDPDDPEAALAALLAGPDSFETDIGMGTAIPEPTELRGFDAVDGAAVVDLSEEFQAGGGSLSMQLRVAQVVFTATQFAAIDAVTIHIDGRAVDGIGGEGVPANDLMRADFESVTPAILPESPLPGEAVSSPLQVSGMSNTFEATLRYALTDPNGLILEEGSATASAGSGAWGSFAFSVEFASERTGLGALITWQDDAATGAQRDVYEVPIRMTAG